MQAQPPDGPSRHGDLPDALTRLLSDDPVEAARARQALGPIASDAAETTAAWLLASPPPPSADMIDHIMARLPERGAQAIGMALPDRAASANAARPSWPPRRADWLRPRPFLLAGSLACLVAAVGLSLDGFGDGGLSAAAISTAASWHLPAAAFSLILALVLFTFAVRRR